MENNINSPYKIFGALTGDSLVPNIASVTELVGQFQSYSIKSAENILLMAKVVFEARAQSNKIFSLFCKGIGFAPYSSSVRKYLVIGKKYDVLSQHTSSLPSNWTTLYTIAQIEGDKLTDLFDAGRIGTAISGREAAILLNKPASRKAKVISTAKQTVPNGTVEGYGFRTRFAAFPADPETIARISALLRELKSLGAEVELATGLIVALAANDEQTNLAA